VTAALKRVDQPVLLLLQGAYQNSGIRFPALRTSLTSAFPFNQTFAKSFGFGGSQVGAQFNAALFVGTNFDCTQPDFNLEGSISANATVTIFSETMTAMSALAIYGQEGSSVVANQLYLEAFGKVVYQQQIPQPDLNCQQHTFPIGSFTAPGFSVDYALWVGCIPVIFSAGATLEAQVSWGWQICPGQLSALVELIPQAKLTASASAETDLLIIEGAVALDAAFSLTLTPQAYIDGTKCNVGLDLLLTADPMAASLDAQWRRQTCAWWFFDCHWGAWNTYSLWSWSAPADNEEIFNQQWPIPH